MFPWDEGAGFAPQVIWNSTMLSGWGNTEASHRGSVTSYHPDDFSAIAEEVRGDHPCFEEEKDVVLPAWKHPRVEFYRGGWWERWGGGGMGGMG